MSEQTLEPELAAATAIGEVDAVAALHDLNSHYIRAFLESDTAWYGEHLSDDFVCTLADGRRIDKTAFLERTADGPGVKNVTYDDVDVRLFGDVALVHGVTHFVRDGAPASTRYTDVWQCCDGNWRAVAAQLTRVAGD